ncbi:MAG: hypothetical protein DCC68_20735 [Planctomycetota bacterium]|nr:MAG: hypothetical protein DCC68_20735 [Planctomycetota bacterium]
MDLEIFVAAGAHGGEQGISVFAGDEAAGGGFFEEGDLLAAAAGGVDAMELDRVAEAGADQDAVAVGGPPLKHGWADVLILGQARDEFGGKRRDARGGDCGRAAGIGDGLVRLSAGIEATDDLVADVRAALSSLG